MAKQVKVDEEKLKKALAKRGYSRGQASKEMGFSESYLHNTAKTGYLALHAIKSLELMFNIKPEEYAPAEATLAKPEPPQNEWARAFAILIKRTEPNELKELIKEAIREVLSE